MAWFLFANSFVSILVDSDQTERLRM